MKAEDGYEISSEIKQYLDSHHWQPTYNKLRKYASDQIRIKYWCGIKGGMPPGGRLADDYVMIAIIKVYRGVRRWDPQKSPDLYLFLKDVIRSELSHHSTSKENVKLRRDRNFKSKNDLEYSFIENYKSPKLGHDMKLVIREYVEGFRDYISDHHDLIEILECLELGIVKPKDIAEELNITSEEMANRRKKFRRYAVKFEKQWMINHS